MRQYFLDIITSWGEEMLQKVFFYIRKHNNKISYESTYQIYVLLLYQCLCIATIGVPADFNPLISTKFSLFFYQVWKPWLSNVYLQHIHTHTHTHSHNPHILYSLVGETHIQLNFFFQNNSVHISSMEIINKLVKLL